jgi:hypothetical protein
MIDGKVYEVGHQANITSDVRGTILRRLEGTFNVHETNVCSFTLVTLFPTTGSYRRSRSLETCDFLRVDTLSNSACTSSIRT